MIHPTAIVHPGARIAADVSVGAYSIIGEHVEIGEGTRIGPHVVVEGHTRIGRDNEIFQFCSIGASPQDKKYDAEPTRLEIGDRNTIREFCSFNVGTSQDAHVTRVGNDNWIMAYVHVAHDCQVGDHTIFANNATLAMMAGAQQNPAAANLVHIPGFLLLGGGVPVKVGTETIGAIGVGGAPGGHLDEQCAVAALDKAKDLLK